MKVIMISLDKTLLDADYSGDAVKRHQEYAKKVDSLDIIVFSKKNYKKKKLSSNCRVYPTNSISKFFYFWDAYKTAKRIITTSGLVSDTLIITQEPFLAGFAGWLIKRKFKTPLLVHFHGDFWDNPYWLKESFLNHIFLVISKFIVKKADGIRVVSSGIKEKLVNKKVNSKKIRVIPTPVNIREFENYNKERVDYLKKEKYQNYPLVINVGRKDTSKDYDTFLKTMEFVCRKFRRVNFLQIGASLGSKFCDDCGESCFFESLDKIKQQELVNYYYAANIYLSTSNHESFGKVLIEAMACGLPVVATATTGSKEIIENEKNGFLVPIGDSEALSKKVIYLLNNPEAAKKMGEQGRITVKEKFNNEKITEEIVEFWKDLVK